MAAQHKLNTTISSLKSAVDTEVKKHSQGAHRQKIAAVEDACKALATENAALKQRLKTTTRDAMRLVCDPDLWLRVNDRSYPSFTALLGPVVAEMVASPLSFSGADESGVPTLSLDSKDKSYSCGAVRTAVGMIHFAQFVPEGTTPQQLVETLQLAVRWELPIVEKLRNLLGQVLARSTEVLPSSTAYDIAVELLSFMEDILGTKCKECHGKCVCCSKDKDMSRDSSPACTCSGCVAYSSHVLCDKCPGTAWLKLRKACLTVLVENASVLSDEVARGLPLLHMLPDVKGMSEPVPALEVRPAQAEELNLVYATIEATIAARAREEDLFGSDSDDHLRDEHSDEDIAARTVDGGKSATAGYFVRVKSTTSTRSPPAVVMSDIQNRWVTPFCTAQEEGPMWHGQDGRLRVASKLAAGTAVVFKASVRIESTWMKYMLIVRFLQAHGLIDIATNASPVQGLIRASAHAVLGAPLLKAMMPTFLEVIARNFDLCDDIPQLDGVSMAQLLTSEQLTVLSENKVMRMFVAWAAEPTRLMHEIGGVAPAVRFPLCKLFPLPESLQGLMKVSKTVRELVNEALNQQMQRTANGPPSLLQSSKRKFLLDSNSELSEIPRTKARKKGIRGFVQKLTAEQLTCHALGMTAPKVTMTVDDSDFSDDSDGY